MDAKLVSESINEFQGTKEYQSPSERGQLTAEQFSDMVDELIEMDDAPEAVRRYLQIFRDNDYIHDELGERPGRDKYKEPADRFIAYYDDYIQSGEFYNSENIE